MNGDRGEQHLETHVSSVKKTGNVILSDEPFEFEYRVQDITDSSPALRHELRGSEKDESVIGLEFEDGTVAWSRSIPRHTVLEAIEKKKAIARFQSHGRWWSDIPEVKIHALKKEDANALAQFMKRSGVHPKTPVELNTVDDVYITTDVKLLWSGKLGDFDTKSLG